jgi:CO/xanthine dehydrogenase Mo-binding subunit/CO/xanthine dehydrogenase FAD-binding subunit
MKTVGERLRARDWEDRTLGRTVYTGDLDLSGLLVGKILWSWEAHADIRRIDTSSAEAMPGVHAVVTAGDLEPGRRYIHEGGAKSDREPLARTKVRYIGEPIAAVAAESEEEANAAIKAIRVQLVRRPAVTTIVKALRPGAPRVHDRESGTNVSISTRGQWGDPEAGKKASSRSVEGSYVYPRVTHVCLEPNVAMASWDEQRARLEMWVSTQAPYFIVKEVANALGLASDQVVLREIAVGGGFGSKSKISEFEVLAGALSIKANRPVRVAYDRDEEFAFTKTRHRVEMRTKTWFDEDGRLRVIEADFDADNGAYNHQGPSILGVGVKLFGSMYRLDGISWTGQLIDTNLAPGGPFRGYGSPQASLAMESQVDEVAAVLDIDPIDIRIANANQPGSLTLSGSRIGSARLVECLKAVREAIGWDAKKKEAALDRGVGVACSIHGSGAYVYDGSNRSEATIDVTDDGTARVHFGGADAGTGQRTILGQIASEELGIPFGEIDVRSMDSETTPHDMGAWASRGTHIMGHATRKATGEMADRLKHLAASKLGLAAADVTLSDGNAHGDGSSISIGDLVALDPDTRDGSITHTGEYVDPVMKQFVPGGDPVNTSATYTFAAHAVEVAVDRGTGEIRILDYVAAHDLGRAINPTLVEGQIMGGVATGLGAALGEELIYENGKLVNGALINYAVPRASDLPDIRTILMEGPESAGPYDAKSVGELPVTPVAAAVANAIADAVGIRLGEPPFTPDKVLEALRTERRPRANVLMRPSRWWISLMRMLYPRGLGRSLHWLGENYGRGISRRPIEAITSPTDMASALLAKQAGGGAAAYVAGSTDLLLQQRQGLTAPTELISLGAIPALKGIAITASGDLRIGAATTLAALEQHHDVPSVLRNTTSGIASPQIREAATVGGNLVQAKRCWFFRNGFNCYKRAGALAPCYAVLGDHRFYHAAVDAHRCQAVTPSDMATALGALDAVVEVDGPDGRREVAIDDFYRGPGEPALDDHELVVAVRLPAAALKRIAAFDKVRLWQGDFAVVSVAIAADLGPDKTWSNVRIVLGAVAPRPYRARRAERTLEGTEVTMGDMRGAVAVELAKAGHSLENNAWKLDAAAAIAGRVAGRLGG